MTTLKELPITDPAPVLAKIKQIIEDAPELSKFEADIVAEIARCAVRFKDTFRISPKQEKILSELWDTHCLPKVIAAKVKDRSKK